jgi:hypothetical protein
MKFAHPSARAAACLLLAAASLHASAQTPAQAGAADPQAAVPATIYRPALGYQAAAAPAATPDQQWKESNATVAATNSMSLTMKDMGASAGHQQHAPLSPSAAIQAQSGASADMCMAGGKAMPGCCCCKDKMTPASPAPGHDHQHQHQRQRQESP